MFHGGQVTTLSLSEVGSSKSSGMCVDLLLMMVSAVGEAAARALQIALAALGHSVLFELSAALGGAVIGTVQCAVDVLLVVTH